MRDIVAPEFGENRGAIIMRDVGDTLLPRTFVGTSRKSQSLVEIFDNYEAARAWVGLPHDYPDPFEEVW